MDPAFARPRFRFWGAIEALGFGALPPYAVNAKYPTWKFGFARAVGNLPPVRTSGKGRAASSDW